MLSVDVFFGGCVAADHTSSHLARITSFINTELLTQLNRDTYLLYTRSENDSVGGG